MQIFRGTEKELKEQYQLNPLAVMWIGVLRKKKIYLTEPVLELAKKDGPLEKLFVDRTLAASIEDFSAFEELQKKHDPNRDFPLTLLDVGKEKVLALRDEMLAEEGWHQEEVEEETGESLESYALEETDARFLGLESSFSEEEISKLKMAIATAVSAQEKIESIRKISFSNLKEKEKNLLFLHTLADSNIEVRKEAIDALEKNNFDHEITHELSSLNEGDSKQRSHSIGSLGELFAESRDIEKAAVLQMFLLVLQEKGYREHLHEVLSTLEKIVPDLPANPAMIDRVMVAMIRNLVSDFNRLHKKIARIFLNLSGLAKEQVTNFLWGEVKKSRERRLRSFLLVCISEVEIPAEHRQEIIRFIIQEVGLGDELDPFYLNLLGILLNLGPQALEMILERFTESSRIAERIQLVSLLDQIMDRHGASKKTKERILHIYIDTFSTAHNKLREAILESTLLRDEQTPRKLRLELAHEMMKNIHREGLDQFADTIRTALLRMRSLSLEVLLQTLKYPVNEKQAIRATEVLGDLVLELPEEDKNDFSKIKTFCMRQIKKDPPHLRQLYVVLGKMVAAGFPDAQEAEEVTDYLLRYVTSSPYAVVEALGWAGASQQISHEKILDICYLLLTLLDNRLPQNLSREKKDAESTIYEFDFKTSAYTDLLPTLIHGLKRIALSENTPLSTTEMIVQRFLRKWTELANQQLVWGPKNITDLAEALYEVCASPRLSLKGKQNIIAALFVKINVFSITRLLVKVLRKESEKEEMLAWVSEMAKKLIEFAEHKDYQNAEDREVIMRCIGELLQAKRLATKKRESEQYRESLLYLLFDGQREQVFGVNKILCQLMDSAHLPKKLKKEIEKRLAKTNYSLSVVEK